MSIHWTDDFISKIEDKGIVTYYGWDERKDNIIIVANNITDVISALEDYYLHLKRRRHDSSTFI